MSLHAQAQARANALLREVHLARAGAGRSNNSISAPSKGPVVVASADDNPAVVLNTTELKGRLVPHRRSAAQRAAAQRFTQPSASKPAAAAAHVAPLAGCEAFYMYQQAAIKEYRNAYNSRVDAHYEALENGRPVPSSERSSISSSPAAALAHEIAGRHVQPITQFVAANGGGPTYRARRQEREAQLAAAANGNAKP